MINGFMGGGMGQGTKIIKKQTEGTELWIYVKQALLGAGAFDVALFLVLVAVLCVGWPSLALVFGGIIGLTWLITKYAILDIAARKRVLRAFTIAWAISFLVFSPSWWQVLIGRGALLALAKATLAPLGMPIWVYGGLLVFWFVGALKQRGKLVAAFIVAALGLYVIYRIGDVDWSPLLVRLRYITPAFLISPIVFALVLTAVMFKEMVLPNLDFTLAPFKYADWIQAGGLLGVLVPRINRALPAQRVRIEETANGGRTLLNYDLPNDEKALEFYRLVLTGALFSYQTAHMRRGTFNVNIKEPCQEHGYIVPEYPDNPRSGMVLTEKGREALEKIVGGDFVPEWED